MRNNSQRGSGAILSYVTIIVNTLVQLLYTPFLIRMLGQSEYGLYSMVSSVIGYLTVLDLGFGNAIVVFTSKYRAQNNTEGEQKLHGMFSVIYKVIGVIATIIGIVLFFNVDVLFGSTLNDKELSQTKIMMLILSLNIGLTFSFSIYSSIITAYEEFVFQKVLSIVNTLMKPLLMIPLLFLGFKSVAMCVVITIVNIGVLFSNFLYCQKRLNCKLKYQGFDIKIFKSIITYSIFIFLTVIVDKVNWSVDQFILGVICGTTAVSVYSIASQLTQLFINLSTAVSGVFLPKVSRMIANRANRALLTDEMIKIGRIQFLIINMMATGLILIGKEFIVWWAGKEYENAYYVALILILPACLPLIQNLGLSIMQAMNKYKFKAIMTTVIAIGNIMISVILADKYQEIGAAIGTALAQIIGNVILINIYYSKVIGLHVMRFWKEILLMFLPLMVPALIMVAIMYITSLEGLSSVIIYGVLYVVLYIIFALKFAMNDYEKNIIKNILGRFNKGYIGGMKE